MEFAFTFSREATTDSVHVEFLRHARTFLEGGIVKVYGVRADQSDLAYVLASEVEIAYIGTDGLHVYSTTANQWADPAEHRVSETIKDAFLIPWGVIGRIQWW